MAAFLWCPIQLNNYANFQSFPNAWIYTELAVLKYFFYDANERSTPLGLSVRQKEGGEEGEEPEVRMWAVVRKQTGMMGDGGGGTNDN